MGNSTSDRNLIIIILHGHNQRNAQRKPAAKKKQPRNTQHISPLQEPPQSSFLARKLPLPSWFKNKDSSGLKDTSRLKYYFFLSFYESLVYLRHLSFHSDFFLINRGKRTVKGEGLMELVWIRRGHFKEIPPHSPSLPRVSLCREVLQRVSLG